MRFADGLPVNLKYPVIPKPKPPLPLFSTMPRTSHKKSADALQVPQCLNSSIDTNSQNTPQLPQKLAQMTAATSTHSNTLKKKSKEHSSSVLSTLRLRKNKHKTKFHSVDHKSSSDLNDEEQLKQAETLLKSLSFSTEFSGLNTSGERSGIVDTDEFYNVPKNNAAIDKNAILKDIQDASSKVSSGKANLEIEKKTDEEVEYFTKSDVVIERERCNNMTQNR